MAHEQDSDKQTGKVFLHLVDPEGTIEEGYTHIAIERSRDGGATWTRVTVAASHIALEEDVYNYAFITDARPGTLFRPVLIGDSVDDVAQAAREAWDTSFENVLSIEELKRIFLTGVDLTNDQNVAYPDEVFAHGIRSAIDRMEHELDVPLQPQAFDERYDFWAREWANWGFVQLRQRPALAVQEVSLNYPTATTPLVFPETWIRLDKHAGEVRIVPGSGSISTFFITAGSHMPFVGYDHLPDLIRVKYTAGFALGVKSPRNPEGLPSDIKEIVGMLGAMGPLNLAGDLIAGAAIASKSIGIDGLSQSVNTTASATNAGYGARLLQYEKQIKAVLPMLRRYYKGARMIVA